MCNSNFVASVQILRCFSFLTQYRYCGAFLWPTLTPISGLRCSCKRLVLGHRQLCQLCQLFLIWLLSSPTLQTPPLTFSLVGLSDQKSSQMKNPTNQGFLVFFGSSNPCARVWSGSSSPDRLDWLPGTNKTPLTFRSASFGTNQLLVAPRLRCISSVYIQKAKKFVDSDFQSKIWVKGQFRVLEKSFCWKDFTGVITYWCWGFPFRLTFFRTKQLVVAQWTVQCTSFLGSLQHFPLKLFSTLSSKCNFQIGSLWNKPLSCCTVQVLPTTTFPNVVADFAFSKFSPLLIHLAT